MEYKKVKFNTLDMLMDHFRDSIVFYYDNQENSFVTDHYEIKIKSEKSCFVKALTGERMFVNKTSHFQKSVIRLLQKIYKERYEVEVDISLSMVA
jgi:phosphoribosylformylglycinamidine (FGAM) synthase-like amidotransferase family enzyme